MICLFAFAIPLVAAPSIASAKKRAATSKKQEKSQNKKIHKLGVDLGTVNTSATKLVTDLGSAKNDITTLNALSSGLPPILTALASGIAKVADVTTHFTYVAFQVYAGSVSSANAVKGCFAESPNLEPTGQTQYVSLSCLAIPGTSAPASAGALKVQAFCRTNKTNVGSNDSSKPCGQAGIVSLGVATIGSAPTTISTSNAQTSGALSGAPVYDILNASPLNNTVDKTFPFAQTAQDLPIELTDNTTNLTAAGATGTPPTYAGSGGGVQHIEITVRALDRTPQGV